MLRCVLVFFFFNHHPLSIQIHQRNALFEYEKYKILRSLLVFQHHFPLPPSAARWVQEKTSQYILSLLRRFLKHLLMFCETSKNISRTNFCNSILEWGNWSRGARSCKISIHKNKRHTIAEKVRIAFSDGFGCNTTWEGNQSAVKNYGMASLFCLIIYTVTPLFICWNVFLSCTYFSFLFLFFCCLFLLIFLSCAFFPLLIFPLYLFFLTVFIFHHFSIAAC